MGQGRIPLDKLSSEWVVASGEWFRKSKSSCWFESIIQEPPGWIIIELAPSWAVAVTVRCTLPCLLWFRYVLRYVLNHSLDAAWYRQQSLITTVNSYLMHLACVSESDLLKRHLFLDKVYLYNERAKNSPDLVTLTTRESPFHEEKCRKKKNQQFSQCLPTLPMGSIDSLSSSPSPCTPSSISILVESGRAQTEAKPATPNAAASP